MDVVNTIKANLKEYKIEDSDAADRIEALEKEVNELKDSLTQLNQSLTDQTNYNGKVFDNTRSLLTQIDELPYLHFCFGYILSSGNQDACEVPANSNFYVISSQYSSASAFVFLLGIGNKSDIYYNSKSGGSWIGWSTI